MYVSAHCNDVIMWAMASQITSLTIVYSTVYSGANQRRHQSSAKLDFVREIHRWPVNSTYKYPRTREMLPFDDVIMIGNRSIYPVTFKCLRAFISKSMRFLFPERRKRILEYVFTFFCYYWVCLVFNLVSQYIHVTLGLKYQCIWFYHFIDLYTHAYISGFLGSRQLM